MSEHNLVRLQKYIADCGVTSRRKAEEMIVQGRVTINGELVSELGTKVNPKSDTVMVDGALVDPASVEKIYMLLHKPRGYMTTLFDPEGRETVMDLCREVSERIYPVGRLDYLSEGLLLMTNDGEMANMVMHPSHSLTKVYEVKIFGSVTETILEKLRQGFNDPEVGMLRPRSVRVIKQLPTKTWVEFRLTDGKNREIRRLCDAVGITIDKLKRIAIEGLTIDGIAPGKFRYITKRYLLEALGVDENGKRLKDAPRYVSSKKTVWVDRKGAQPGTASDDRAFAKFKKETYYTSLKEIAETKAKKREEAIARGFEEKEAAHQKRKEKKVAREQRKNFQKKGTHAQFAK